MTTATRKTVLAGVSVESLGVEYPDYFQGYGLGPSSKYTNCTYGIGDTEEEALEDCMEMMAQNAGFDFDENVERRIRKAYGKVDGNTTVAEYLGLDGSDEEDDATIATRVRSFTSVLSGARRRFDRAGTIAREGPVMPALFFAPGGTGRADAQGNVEPAAGRLPCPMPSGRCPGQCGTGLCVPVALRPMPREPVLALPVEPAGAHLSGRCPGQRGTGRGPVTSDALRPVAQGVGACPARGTGRGPIFPADAQAMWNRPWADALRPMPRDWCLPCPWNRPRADLSGRCPGQRGTGRGPMPCPMPWESVLALPDALRPVAQGSLCLPCPWNGPRVDLSGLMPRATWSGLLPVALPDALRPVALGVGALPCPWNRPRADLSGRCPGQCGTGRAPVALRPMPSGRCPGSRRLPCPWNRPRADLFGRCPGQRGTGRGPMPCPMPSGRCPGSRRLPCPWNRPRADLSGRCPGQCGTGRAPVALRPMPRESALALPVEPAAGRSFRPMPRATWNRPRADALPDALRPMPWESALALPVEPAAGRSFRPMPRAMWNRPRAGCPPADAQGVGACLARGTGCGPIFPADAQGNVEPAAGRCPARCPPADALGVGACPARGTGRGPIFPADAQGNVEPAAGRCPARCPPADAQGVGACPARGTGRADLSSRCPGQRGTGRGPMPRATWNRPRADAQGNVEPAAHRCPPRCPPAGCPGYVITRKLLSIILPSDNRREILPSLFDYSTI